MLKSSMPLNTNLSFDEFVEGYQPLYFKWFLFNFTERILRASLLGNVTSAAKISIKVQFGLQVNYFDLRASLTPEARKIGDLRVITYFIRKHERDAEGHSGITYLRYLILRTKYWPETNYVYKVLAAKDLASKESLNAVNNYVLRWTYLLPVEPSFAELLHGTAPEVAFDSIENLY